MSQVYVRQTIYNYIYSYIGIRYLSKSSSFLIPSELASLAGLTRDIKFLHLVADHYLYLPKFSAGIRACGKRPAYRKLKIKGVRFENLTAELISIFAASGAEEGKKLPSLHFRRALPVCMSGRAVQ